MRESPGIVVTEPKVEKVTLRMMVRWVLGSNSRSSNFFFSTDYVNFSRVTAERKPLSYCVCSDYTG